MKYLEGKFQIIAKTLPGLEEILRGELLSLGADNIHSLTRGAEFEGDKETLYKVNYCCRNALRFLVPLTSFHAPNETLLYERVKKIPWDSIFKVHQTFAIDANTFDSRISHSRYLTQKTKDAIADHFREKYSRRPTVNTEDPEIRINIHLNNNTCTVSLDSSGGSLHLRGYRKRNSPAPLNEVLASGIIDMSGWNGTTDFIDPMCGSGTLVIEAAMKALKLPPGKIRKHYGLMNWLTFDDTLWNAVKQDADDQILKTLPCRIEGSDADGNMISVSRSHSTFAGVRPFISLKKANFLHRDAPFESGTLITNPPYGERIPLKEPERFYKTMGDTLKHKYTGYSAWILTADYKSAKHTGLRTSKKIRLYNGQLECRLLNFEIYPGSLKKMPRNKT
ncbi:MAG: class I SAM-dependent RNA methyltransferase [Bacteroidales bacterium]